MVFGKTDSNTRFWPGGGWGPYCSAVLCAERCPRCQVCSGICFLCELL